MKIDYSDISQYNSFPVTEELHQNAYFNWLNAGCPEGRELEFWCEAEREMFGYTSGEMDELLNPADHLHEDVLLVYAGFRCDKCQIYDDFGCNNGVPFDVAANNAMLAGWVVILEKDDWTVLCKKCATNEQETTNSTRFPQ